MAQQFYIQNVRPPCKKYPMLWWSKDDCGWVFNIKLARIFFVPPSIASWPSIQAGTERAWPIEYIKSKALGNGHISIEKVDHEEAMEGVKL